MEKLIIAAAICGAEVTKEHNPAVPYTVEEIVREAKSAYDAGAAVIHLHVREDDGTPTQSHERFQECMDAIYAVCPDVIIQPSTGGAVGMTDEERLDSGIRYSGLRHMQLWRRRDFRKYRQYHSQFRPDHAGEGHEAGAGVLR